MAERPEGYGMTAEIKAKIYKYDTDLESEARTWLQEVTGEPFPTGLDPGSSSLQEALKDGVYLCKAINALQPGSVPKINDSKMAFKMLENIGTFLSACEKFGCMKCDLFQPVDLYEAQNLPQVVNTIVALSRKAQAKGLKGFGPKDNTEYIGRFTDLEERTVTGTGLKI